MLLIGSAELSTRRAGIAAALVALSVGGSCSGTGNNTRANVALAATQRDAEGRTGAGGESVRGMVRGPDGQPLAGAMVALVDPTDPNRPALVETGADGGFSVESWAATSYAITVTARAGAAYLAPGSAAEAVGELRIAAPSHRVSGRVTDQTGRPVRNALVMLLRVSGELGDTFYVRTDDAGTYGTGFAQTETVLAVVLGGDQFARPQSPVLLEGAETQLDLRVVTPDPAPPAVVAELRAAAIPLASTSPEVPLAEPERIGRIVGDAQIVAMGEATHGTAEFFEAKDQLFRLLVERHGFAGIAVEANLTECRAVNDYVLRGVGNPAVALRGAYFFTVANGEMLRLVEWMRRYNADEGHSRKLQFHGLDMQASHVAARKVLEFMARVAPERLAALQAAFAPLRPGARARVSALAAEQQAALAAAIDGLAADLDARRAPMIAASDASAWAAAREDVRLLRQAVELYTSSASENTRDRLMADNALRLATGDHPMKLALWAHNRHVQRVPISPAFVTMGSHLANELGAGYVSVGFLFGRGAFRAADASQPGRPHSALSLPPARPGSIEAAFAATGLAMFALPVNALPRHSLAYRWLDVERPTRLIGGAFFREETAIAFSTLTREFDAVIFIGETHAAAPLSWRNRLPVRPENAPTAPGPR